MNANSLLSLFVGSSLFAAFSSAAGLVVADFDDLAPGPLGSATPGAGQDGGTGWTPGSTWDEETIEVIAGNLTAPTSTNYAIVPSGGSELSVQGSSPPSQSTRAVGATLVDEVWFSFLLKQPNSLSRGGISFNGPGGDPTNPRVIAAGNEIRLALVTLQGAGSGAPLPPGQDILIVGRIRINPAGDENLAVWVNPDVAGGVSGLGAPDTSLTQDATILDGGITRIGFQSYGAEGDEGGIIDSFRISDRDERFFDVTGVAPPATAAGLLSADFDDLAPGPLGNATPGAGQEGGLGWMPGSTWDDDNSIEVIAGNLTPPTSTNYAIVQAGGSEQSVRGSSPPRQSTRAVAPLIDEVWFSFLLRQPDSLSRGGISFNGPGGDPTNPRVIATGNEIRLGLVTLQGAGTGAPMMIGADTLVLGRLRINPAGNESLAVWINPDVSRGIGGLGVPDNSLTQDAAILDGGITRIGIQSYGAQGGEGGIIDSFRLSNREERFFDVTGVVDPAAHAGNALVYRKHFNSRSAGGWTADAATLLPNGGVGDSAYLRGTREALSPIFLPGENPAAQFLTGELKGRFGSKIRISYQGRTFSGNSNPISQTFFIEPVVAGSTFWSKDVANGADFQGGWAPVAFEIDTDWTDQEAAANGWTRLRGSDSWSDTVRNLGRAEFFKGSGNTGSSRVAGIDDIQVQPAELLAYYPFDGNANDIAGQGSDGTVTGATLTEDRDCQPGGAYHFNDAGDLISIPGFAGSPPAGSITAWVTVEGFDTGSNQLNLIFGQNDNLQLGLGDSSSGADGKWVFRHRSGAFQNAVGPDSVLNEWTHVAGVWDGTNAILYLNGIEAARVASGALTGGGGGARIGAHPSSDQNYWMGRIDDVMLFERALAPDEIARLASGISYSNELPEIKKLSYDPDRARVSLFWEQPTRGIMIQSSDDLISWSDIAGPISDSCWSSELPGAPTRLFLRLRKEVAAE